MRHRTRESMPTVPLISNNNNNQSLPTMESLQLPAELFWDVKSERISPPSSELFPLADYNIAPDWMEEDNIVNEIIASEDDSKIRLGIEEACELLFDGEDLVMELCNLKHEQWNNTKPHTTTTAFVDDYMIETTVLQPHFITKVPFEISSDSSVEFCTTTPVGEAGVYATSNIDTAVLTQLTPPHSPPLQNINIINNAENANSPASNFSSNNTANEEQPLEIQFPVPQQQQSQQQQPHQLEFSWSQRNTNDNTIVPTIIANGVDNDIQTQIIDEIVNCRVKELLDWHDEFESLSTSSSSSLAASFRAEESVTEEEWLQNSDYFIDSATTSASASPTHLSNDQQLQQQHNGTISTTAHAGQSKKRRPYGRAVEDRKIRKKEQNKNAATRYRQKKKLEMECVLSEEQTLLDRHEELKREFVEREREAKYLRRLIREFYQKQQELKNQQQK